MPTKSNNTGGRGGARPGAGRKKSAVKDKAENGNPGGRKLEVLDIPEVEGVDMPKPHDFLSAEQRDGSVLQAQEIYTETWQWLKGIGCAAKVSPQLLERYAMCSARWVQCEEMTNRMGFLSKHPTKSPGDWKTRDALLRHWGQHRGWQTVFQNRGNRSELYPLRWRLREVRGMGACVMRTTTEMKLVPIAKLVPYVNNARTHSPEQINKLRSSLREFGFINPVIIDRDYGVIAGHGRILAAKEEGITEVPCVFADHLTEAQKKAYIIADNRMAMDAGWDEELLRVEIESLQAADFDPLLTGFDEKELSKLFDDGKDIQEDDFDVDAELQKPTFTKSGDVWTLGRHRLVCGDSTKEATYAALMDDRKANLVITDPPYNVNYEGSAGKIKNDNMDGEKFYQFLFDAFSCMEKAMADDASIYVFHADTEGLNFRRAFADAGFYLSGCCIWKKQSLVLGRSPYQWQHEPCLYGWKKKGKHQWYTGRKESTIWEFDKPKKNGDHPTMKPIPLLAYPIQNSSMANSVVLDPFGGSGSTLIACEQTDRICCTIELDEKFCDVIVRRYIEQVGSDEKVSVLRDGRILPFREVAGSDDAVQEGGR